MSERNKAAILRSGIDPDLKRLNKLHAIRTNQERKYVRALESIENYWDQVFAAIDEQESQQSA